MAKFMDDHPREKEDKGEECGLIVISRDEKPQAIKVLAQPTFDPGQEQ
jgi:hypothetical protein